MLEEKKRNTARGGNWTRAKMVMGNDTNHYATSLYIKPSINKLFIQY